jgi:uncharacterized membrane protein
VRPSISRLIALEHPDWQDGKFICRRDFNTYRRRHIETLLEDEAGEIGKLDQEVIDSLTSGELVARDPTEQEKALTLGDRAADRVATFGGSWTFIMSFSAVLVIWMTLNVTGLFFKPFDPYPFILLNLLLSCVAAFQAPVIMMSQRRKEEKDRQRAENDYQVNLKAELEIRQLHEKLDHQIMHQWTRLNELQQVQIDLLEERNGD